MYPPLLGLSLSPTAFAAQTGEPQLFLQTTTQALNTAVPAEFSPDLTQFDALVESLQIKE